MQWVRPTLGEIIAIMVVTMVAVSVEESVVIYLFKMSVFSNELNMGLQVGMNRYLLGKRVPSSLNVGWGRGQVPN